MKIYDVEEDRFYSINEVEEERLYSTGDEELDILLERAFSEGYEYAQREFTKARQLKKNGVRALQQLEYVPTKLYKVPSRETAVGVALNSTVSKRHSIAHNPLVSPVSGKRIGNKTRAEAVKDYVHSMGYNNVNEFIEEGGIESFIKHHKPLKIKMK